jgi:nucleoside-diphosphate-sugar epimerase
MADSYQHVIDQAATGARLVRLPRTLTIFILRVLHTLRLSPLGPYQYRMIASSFQFDTTKLRHDADWQPTKTNSDMLMDAYSYYKANKTTSLDPTTSAHNRVANGGLINLLRRFS